MNWLNKMKILKRTINLSLKIAVLSSVVTVTQADDTDIFSQYTPVPPNVLFVFDNSGSMKREVDSEDVAIPPVPSRLESLRTALGTLLTDPDLPDINLGLMNFSGHSGPTSTLAHGPSYPVAHKDANARLVLGSTLPLASDTSKDYLQTIAAGWSPDNYTPLVDALYEAALYFKGEPVNYGNYLPGNPRAAHPSTYTGTIGTNATYISPIKEECQSNHIVLLSDGKPTVNNSKSAVQSLIGIGSCAINDSDGNGTDDFGGDGRCGPELANYLANTDHLTTGPNKLGDHRINVHTIGFAVDPNSSTAKYLKSLADNGNGVSATANSTNELVAKFKEILDGASDDARLFSSPSYTVNTKSRLSHGNEVYLPVFKPGTSSVWSGNLKQFKLGSNGELLDKNDALATDVDGNLKADAEDNWASSSVSDAVTGGGAANKLNPDSRKLFTNSGSAIAGLNNSYPAIKTLLGDASMSNAHRDALLNFIKGKYPDGTSRYHMGDIIHSKPKHLNYGTRGIVFVGTNEGYLHAIYDDDGSEAYAFMPSELLKNIQPQYDTVINNIKSDHLYGLDGEITLWHDDLNNDAIKDNNEDAMLYLGLRRGGKSYYALDIKNRDNPKVLWKIDNNSIYMSKLAHTWSKPVIAKLKYKPHSTPQDVLIFGGGYSEDASGNEISGIGNAVYIVNAKTGAFIWSTDVANSGKINHAVPSRIRVLDVDRNGSVDRLYFADTGGFIWRADLNASDLDGSGDYSNINKATLTKFADLGAVTSPATSSRKFFVEPDVAIFKHHGQFVLSVSIGSGDRPQPLDTNGDDRFFALFDENVFNLPDPLDPVITISDLVAAPTTLDLTSKLRSKKGWYKDLNVLAGEKVLSTALTFNNKVLFTSFGGLNSSASPSNVCDNKITNGGRLYVLGLLSGGAVLDLDKDGIVEPLDDSGVPILPGGNIPPRPQVIFREPGGKNGGPCVTGDCKPQHRVCVGLNCFADQDTVSNQPVSNKLPRVYWLDREK